MKKLNTFYLLLFLLSSIALAQEITLSDAQKIAIENNPRLKQAEADVAISSASRLQTISAHLPQVSASSRHLFTEKFQTEVISLGGPPVGLPLIEPNTDFSATVSLMVFDGLSSWYSYKAARSNYAADELNYSWERFQLEEDIKVKFYQVIGSRDMVDVAGQNVQVLEQHLQDIMNQIKGGVAIRFDSLRIEVQLEDAKTELLSAKDNLILAEAKLAQTLGLEQFSGVVNGKMPSILEENISKADFSPGQRDDRKAQELRDESAIYSSRAAKGQWFPKIKLFASEMLYDGMVYDTSTKQTSGSQFKNAYWLGLILTWNIFDGGATIANAKIASAQRSKSTEKLRELNQSIPVDTDFWKRRLFHSAASYRAASTSVEKSEESVRLARNAVRAGVRTNTDLLDAERDLYTSRLKLVKAQLEAIESEANLELALGKKLNLFQGV